MQRISETKKAEKKNYSDNLRNIFDPCDDKINDMFLNYPEDEYLCNSGQDFPEYEEN